MLRTIHNFQILEEYKKSQVKKVVRKAKRNGWRECCNKIGRTTLRCSLGNKKDKKKSGIRREWQCTVLKSGEIIAKTFVEIHSSKNVSQEGIRGRNVTRDANLEALQGQECTEDAMDAPFMQQEMSRAIDKSRLTSPGKDQICYTSLKQLGI